MPCSALSIAMTSGCLVLPLPAISRTHSSIDEVIYACDCWAVMPRLSRPIKSLRARPHDHVPGAKDMTDILLAAQASRRTCRTVARQV
jgi:hypothetical protein